MTDVIRHFHSSADAQGQISEMGLRNRSAFTPNSLRPHRHLPRRRLVPRLVLSVFSSSGSSRRRKSAGIGRSTGAAPRNCRYVSSMINGTSCALRQQTDEGKTRAIKKVGPETGRIKKAAYAGRLSPNDYHRTRVSVYARGSGPCWKWYCRIRAASAGVIVLPLGSIVRTTSPRQTTSVEESPAISAGSTRLISS